jgi:hypothetical protein
MRKVSVSVADAMRYMPRHPERTAHKDAGWDVIYQEWPSRGAMARSIRMQEQRAPRSGDWRACVPLDAHEGR